MKTRTALLVAATLLALVACSGTSATPAPTGSATPSPTPGTTPAPSPPPAAKSITDLGYVLITQLGRPDWCDPDVYPLARDNEGTLALQHLADMKADAAVFASIIRHLGIDPTAELTSAQLLAVYQDWKVLTKAVLLQPSGNAYSFDYIALVGAVAKQNDFHVAGSIDRTGNVTVTINEETQAPPCPICLARGTLIDTPTGLVHVQDLLAGMAVWSVDGSGQRVAARISIIGSTPVPATHRVVHLELADGRTVDASPGHPLPDGRRIGDLRIGDTVDGSTVIAATLVAYAGGATYDLLPDTVTGAYWANGILLGSTLAH